MQQRKEHIFNSDSKEMISQRFCQKVIGQSPKEQMPNICWVSWKQAKNVNT